ALSTPASIAPRQLPEKTETRPRDHRRALPPPVAPARERRAAPASAMARRFRLQWTRCCAAAERTRTTAARPRKRSVGAAYVRKHLDASHAVPHEGILHVPRIPGQNRRDPLFHLFELLLVENHGLETLVIPGDDEGAEGVDTALQRLGKLGIPVDCFATELAIEHFGGERCRFHRDGDAGRKYRIEKFAGVAEQRKARSAQRFHAGGITGDRAHRKQWLGPRQQIAQRRLLAEDGE